MSLKVQNPSFKKTLALLGVLLVLLAIAGGAHALQLEQPSQTGTEAIQGEEDFEPPSDLLGPFDEALAEESGFAYLIAPRSLSSQRVLHAIRTTTGKEGLLIQKDATVLSANVVTGELKGDLYQYQYGDYDAALTALLGPDIYTRQSYISSSLDTGMGRYFRYRFLSEEGRDFMVYTRYVEERNKVVYSEQALPDLITQCIEKECGDINFLHLDLERGVFVVGYTKDSLLLELEKSNNQALKIYRKVEDKWQLTFERQFSSEPEQYASLIALASPDRSELAISNFIEFYDDESPKPPLFNVILDMDTLSLREVALPTSLFPTFWASQQELLYGYAAPKDCGYYPHEATLNLITGQVHVVSDRRNLEGAWYERYLYPYGTVYASAIARVADTGYRSPIVFGGSMCDDGETVHILSILTREGGARPLFTAPEDTYIRSMGFVNDHTFLIAVIPVTDYRVDTEYYSRPVKIIEATGKPTFKLIDVRTSAVTNTIPETVRAMGAEGSPLVTYDEYRYVKQIDSSTIDVDFTTLILKVDGSPIDRIDHRSFEDDWLTQVGYRALGEGQRNISDDMESLQEEIASLQ